MTDIVATLLNRFQMTGTGSPFHYVGTGNQSPVPIPISVGNQSISVNIESRYPRRITLRRSAPGSNGRCRVVSTEGTGGEAFSPDFFAVPRDHEARAAAGFLDLGEFAAMNALDAFGRVNRDEPGYPQVTPTPLVPGPTSLWR